MNFNSISLKLILFLTFFVGNIKFLEAKYCPLNKKVSGSIIVTEYTREGGYEDFQLEKDIFIINYHGSHSDCATTLFSGWDVDAGKKRIYSYALKRAGEVALSNGYPYFSILEEIQQEYPEGLYVLYKKYNYKPKNSVSSVYLVTIKIKCLHKAVEGAYETGEVANF